jgi:hypothetical protein
MRQHFADNDVVGSVIQGAIGTSNGYALYPLNPEMNVGGVYGTGIIEPDPASFDAVNHHLEKLHHEGQGHVIFNDQPFRIIQTSSFGKIIEQGGRVVDFLDIDIQGSELGVIQDSILIMNESVKRVHIGTHARHIDDGLYEILIENGWSIQRFYNCRSGPAFGSPLVHGELGRLSTGDGIISAFNLRFSAA